MRNQCRQTAIRRSCCLPEDTLSGNILLAFCKKTSRICRIFLSDGDDGVVMRALKILPGIGFAVLLTSCAAFDRVTSFVDVLAHQTASSQAQGHDKDSLTATEDAPFSLQLKVADADLQYGDKLSFSALRLPAWLYLTNEGVLEGTPENQDVGAHDIQVRVSDLSGQSDELSLTITVKNVNDAPSVVTTALGHATQDTLYEQQLDYEDIDIAYGDTLRFTGLSLPGWLNLSPDGVLSGTPLNDDVGVHEVVVEISDSGKLTAQQSFVIEVKNVNDAPVFLNK